MASSLIIPGVLVPSLRSPGVLFLTSPPIVALLLAEASWRNPEPLEGYPPSRRGRGDHESSRM